MKKKFKDINYFILGLFFSALISISIELWSEYLIRFFDMLPHSEPFRTYLAVIGGGITIIVALIVLYRLGMKEY